MKFASQRQFLIAFFAVFAVLGAWGQHVWLGGTPGNETAWDEPDNWDPATVPGSADGVKIPEVATQYPVLDTARTINSIELATGAELNLGGFALNVDDYAEINGTLIGGSSSQLNFGSISSSGAINIDGELVLSASGQFSFSGIINATTGNLRLEAASNIELDGSITTAGGNIIFADALVLIDELALDTGGGDIIFASTISNTASRNLALTAGSGSIGFGGAVGTGTALGAITVSSAANLAGVTGHAVDTDEDAASIRAASFTQSTGSGTSRFGSIDATGQVYLQNNTIQITDDLTSANDDISIFCTVLDYISGTLSASDALSLNAGSDIGTSGNAIQSTSGVLSANSAAGSIYIENTGNVIFKAVALGSINIKNTGTLTSSDAITSDSTVALTSTGDMEIAHNLRAQDGVDIEVSNGQAFINSAGNIATTNNSIIILADSISLTGGSINAGAGLVKIRPITSTTGISIGGGSAPDFVVLQSDINSVSSTSTLVIGDENCDGGIVIAGSVSRTGNLTLHTGGAISHNAGTLSASGNLVLNAFSGIGNIAGTSPLVIAPGAIYANNTDTGDLYLSVTGTVTLTGINQYSGGNAMIDATGDIAIGQNVNVGAGSLVLNATGAISRSGAYTLTAATLDMFAGGADGIGTAANAILSATGTITASSPAGSVYIQNTGDVDFHAVSNGYISIVNSGTVSINNDTHGNTGLEIMANGAGSIIDINAELDVSGGQLALDAQSRININATGSVSATAAGNIEFGNNLPGQLYTHSDITTDGGYIRFATGLNLEGDISISSGGGDIIFASTISNTTSRNLTLTAGAGSIGFGGAVGSAGNPLGALTVSSAAGIAGVSGSPVNVNPAANAAAINATSFTQGNGTGTSRFGTIAATGGGIDIANNTIILSGDLQSSAIVRFRAPVELAANIAIITGTDDIIFASSISNTASQSLTLTAGTGSIGFGGAVGSGTALGAITVNSAVNLAGVTGNTVNTGADAAGIRAASFTQIAGTGTSRFGSLEATGNISITSAAITHNGTVLAGTTYTATGGAVTINGQVTAPDGFSSSGSSFTNTLPGTISTTNSTITINHSGAVNINGSLSSGSGAIDIDSTGSTVNLNAGITVSTGTVTIDSDSGTTITAIGTLNASGAANIRIGQTLTGAISTAANITTAGGSILFARNTTLAGNIALSTGVSPLAGDIVFSGTVSNSAPQDLTLTAGTGSIGFGDAVGAGTALGDITVSSATNLAGVTGHAVDTDEDAAGIRAASFNQIAGTGTSRFGSLEATGNVSITSASIIHNGTVLAGGSYTASGNAITHNDTVQAGTTYTATGGAVTINGQVTAPGGFSSSGSNFTNTPAGTISTTNSTITVNHSGAVNINGSLSSGSGSIDIDSTGSTVNLNAGITVSTGTVTIDSDSGTTITAIGTLNATGAANIRIGQTLTGAISTAAGITTAGGSILFAQNTTLAGNIALSTGAGAGDIVFSGTVDGGHTLGLTAGTGSIGFGGAVGAGTALGAITVNSAANLAGVTGNTVNTGADAAGIRAASFIQIAGTGTGRFGSLEATGNISITSASIIHNGTVLAGGSYTASGNAITHNDTVQAGTTYTATGGAVTINGQVTAPGGFSSSGSSFTNAPAGNISTTNSTITINHSGAVNINGSLNSGSGAIDIDSTGSTVNLNAGITVSTGTVTIDSDSGTTITAISTLNASGAANIRIGQTLTGAISTASDITTAGGSILFARNTTLAGNIALSTGVSPLAGDIVFSGTVDGGHTLGLTAGSGSIGFGGAVGAGTALGDITIVSAANLAGVAGNAVNTDADAAGIRAASFIQIAGTGTGRFGSLEATGNISITSASIIHNGTVLAGGSYTASGNAITHNDTVQAGTTYTATGGAVTINGQVTAPGGFSSSGSSFTNAPAGNISTTNSTITINHSGAVNINGSLNSGSGAIDIDSTGSTVNLNAGITVSTGTVTIDSDSGTTITGNGTLNASGAANIRIGQTLTGAISTASDITTAGGSILFARNTTLAGNIALSTGVSPLAGDIVFSGTVDGGHTLGLTAGSGSIGFGGAVGAGTALGDITIVSAANLAGVAGNAVNTDADAAGIRASSFTLPASASTNTIRLSTIAATAGNINITSTNIVHNGTVTTTGANSYSANGDTITINAPINVVSGPVAIDSNTSTTVTGSGHINATGAASISFGATGTGPLTTSGNITTVNGIVRFYRPVNLSGGIAINTGGGDIVFASAISNTASQTLILTAGAGSIGFGGAVGSAGNPLGAITINSAAEIAGVTINNVDNGVDAADIYAISFTQNAGTGTSRFGTITATAGNIDISSSNIIHNGTVSATGTYGYTANGDTVTINAPVNIVSGTVAIDSNTSTTITAAGTIAASAAGNVIFGQSLAGQLYTHSDITTAGGYIRFARGLNLENEITISTGAGPGDIIFASTINNSTSRDLTLIAGTGSIGFGGAVGAGTALGDINISIAANIAGVSGSPVNVNPAANTATINATSFTQSNGTGTSRFGAIASTAGNIDITGANIIHNGAVTTTGTNSYSANGLTVTVNAPINVVSGPVLIDSNTGTTVTAAGNITATGPAGISFGATRTGPLATSGDILTSGGTVRFHRNVELAGNISIDTGTVAGDIIFDNTIDGTFGLDLNASTGNITFTGDIGSTMSVNRMLVRDAGTVNFNGTVRAQNGVISLATADSSWTGAGQISFPNTDLYLDHSGWTLDLLADLECRSLYFYRGNLDINDRTITTTQDFVVFGPAYNPDDPEWVGDDTRFAYFGADSLNYYPSGGSEINDTNTNAAFTDTTGLAGATISVGQNFYNNGADMDAGDFDLNLNSAIGTDVVFNDTGAVTEFQWGSPYAVAFNMTVAGSTANKWITAASGDGSPEHEAQKVIDGGGNHNWQFRRPVISTAATVYDKVIHIRFQDDDILNPSPMFIENTNNEINTLVSAAAANLDNGGVWYSGGSIKILGAYLDADFTQSTDGAGNISEFYLLADLPWNTDATGSNPGHAISTDRNGEHQTTVPDLSWLPGLFRAAEGKTMVQAYGSHTELTTPFTGTVDECRPVLVTVELGTAAHSLVSMQPYDGHYFIQLKWSERVNIGTGPGFQINDSDPAFNVRSDEFSNPAEHGGYASGPPGFTLAGFFSSDGSADIRSRDILYDDKTINGLYRTGPNTLGDHGLYISIAGWSFEIGGTWFWPGYINSTVAPSGNFTALPNSNITDIVGNVLDEDGGNASITGTSWDLSEPAVAQDPLDLPEYYKVVPYIINSGETRVERFEFEFTKAMRDSSLTYPKLDPNSLDTDNPAFEFKRDSESLYRFGGSEFATDVQSLYLTVVPNDFKIDQDDKYFSIAMTALEMNSSWLGTSQMSFRYSQSDGYLTDLAGNLLPDTEGLCVEKIPPLIRLITAIEGGERVYLAFTEPVRNAASVDNEILPGDFMLGAGIPSISMITPITQDSQNYIQDAYIDFASALNLDNLIEGQIALEASIVDRKGNFAEAGSYRPLADIAMGVIDVLAASDGIHDGEIDSELGPGSLGLLRNFDGSGRLYDMDVTLFTNLSDDAGATQEVLSLYYDVDAPLYAFATNPVGGKPAEERLWLPLYLPGFNLSGNTDARVLAPFYTAPSPSGVRNFLIPASDPEVKDGARVEFMFTLGHLFLAREARPGDPASFDLWSYNIRDVIKQRGGVTILNNVIDSVKQERTAIQVDIEEGGQVSILVFTLDGDVVKSLHRGRLGAGNYTFTWDGSNLSGSPVARGMYFIRVVGPGLDEMRKVMVIKD